jgi:hypothetical protein
LAVAAPEDELKNPQQRVHKSIALLRFATSAAIGGSLRGILGLPNYRIQIRQLENSTIRQLTHSAADRIASAVSNNNAVENWSKLISDLHQTLSTGGPDVHSTG